MKKLLSFATLFTFFAVIGCSCSKTGEYKFDSIVVNNGNEEKIYTCTTDVDTVPACDVYEGVVIELTKSDKFIAKVDGKKISEAWYKIEDGKIMIKNTEDGEYEAVGICEEGIVTLDYEFDSDVKIIFKK